MQRRKFLRTAALGAGGVVSVSTLSAPAIAQSMPELKWRLASSFPKSLDTLYGAGEVFAKYINEMTDHTTETLPNLYLGGTGPVFPEFWQGDLAEIIVYNREVEWTERVKVENYLNTKYGLTAR